MGEKFSTVQLTRTDLNRVLCLSLGADMTSTLEGEGGHRGADEIREVVSQIYTERNKKVC